MKRLESLSGSRRTFLKSLAIGSAAGYAWLRGSDARAAMDIAAADMDPPGQWPRMDRRPLGATGFEASPLLFGCGAALALRRRDELLDAAFDAGINVFDVGHRAYYRNAETHLAPFLKRRRDEVFLISKGLSGLELQPGSEVTPAQARQAAATWTKHLDESLADLGVDSVDAYYLMAANNASLVASDEILSAAERARQAGKMRFFGLSTHQDQENVLEAAMKAGLYKLAMIAVTPAGWYDWESKGIAPDTRSMSELQPFLARVKNAGIALVGMKAGRYIAGRWFSPFSNTEAFDAYYDKALLSAKLSPFQRSYAFVLAHGLDVVNADMQSMESLRENVVAAANSETLFA